jgi:hypothetical protein
MPCRLLLSFILMVAAGLGLLANKGEAATFDRNCVITASGSACMFTIQATAAGNLSVSTRACVVGQRWRAIIAKINTGEVVSQVSTGSITAFTGRAVRSTTIGAKFVVIVSIESPVLNNFAAAVVIRFAGAFTTVAGPRPNGAGVLLPSAACGVDQSRLTVGGTFITRPTIPIVPPLVPSMPATTVLLPPTSTLLPPTSIFLSPTTMFGTGTAGF